MKENLEEKLAKYRSLTKLALEKVEIRKEYGKKLLEMAKAYYEDAQYFEKKGLKLTALAAYSYAHAWIDAGVRIGLLDGKNDDNLFVLP
ncbi:MAG: DUF357 domain-containing protein [Candidatus Diapherotrites archaeon]